MEFPYPDFIALPGLLGLAGKACRNLFPGLLFPHWET